MGNSRFVSLGLLLLLTICTTFAQTGNGQNPPTTIPPAANPTEATPLTSAPGGSIRAGDTPFQRGINAFRAGDLQTALREMQAAVKANDRDAAAQRWLGFLWIKNSDPAKASAPLERALVLLTPLTKPSTNPAIPKEIRQANAAQARADLADTYANLGDALLQKPSPSKVDTARAVEAFRRAAQLSPNVPIAFYNLGFAFSRVQKYDQAATAYRKALSLAPKDERAWRSWSGLGFALQKQGVAKYAEAADAYKAAANLKPLEPSLWIGLGTVQLERGASFRGSAIDAFEKARKLDEKNYAATVGLARAYAEAGRFEDAGPLFADAVELPPAKDPNIAATLWYNRGVVLARAKRLDQARAAYEQALGLKPRYFDALVNLGFVLYQDGKTDDAIARFRQALNVSQNSFLAWSNLGAALLQKKDVTGAIQAWRRAAQLDEKNYAARAVLADLLVQQERTDEAIPVYRQMAVLKPNLALPMNALGLAYQKKGDANDAFAAFVEAVRREPRNATSRNNLGVLYEKRNQLSDAIREYKNALVLDPNFADARANLSRFGSQAASISATVIGSPPSPKTSPKSATTGKSPAAKKAHGKNG